ncbi:MAG: hypothetical protein WCG85_25230 [Polyangia bacterium]
MDKTKTKKRRKRGRPPLPPGQVRADDLRVTLRLRTGEREQVEALAVRWGVTVGECLRRCFDMVAKQKGD